MLGTALNHGPLGLSSCSLSSRRDSGKPLLQQINKTASRTTAFIRNVIASAEGYRHQTGLECATLSSPHSRASVFQEDSLFAEIADQIKRYPERDDILVEKQAQKTHIPYAVNGNSRAGRSDKHGAGGKEHHCGDEAT